MNTLLAAYPTLSSCTDSIRQALAILCDTVEHDGLILLCGNGGSAADCDHIVGELMKGFLLKRPDYRLPEWASPLQRSIRAISLPSQSAVISAFNNDVASSLVYAQLTQGYGRPGDCLIGLSTSGSSENVVAAWKIAREIGMYSIALTGANQCEADKYCNVVIHAPATETYRVQEYHLPIYHYLCAELEARLFVE